MAKKLTLEVIGQMAGVSRATVSRVINKPDSVRPELRERVERVIAETGFRPNAVARSLASSRTNILGLIIPSVSQTLFTDPYFSHLIQGISQACNINDYTLSLFVFHSHDEEERVFQRALGTGLIDGLIITTDRVNEPFINKLLERELPFIYIGHPPLPSQVSYIDVDNVAATFVAVKHLIRLGYQRIAHIAAPANKTVGIDRKQGYINALLEAGRRVDEKLIAYGNFTEDSGYTAMRQLLEHQPDAISTASDVMAIGAMHAINDAGLSVPDDVAVVGFDDLTLASTAEPPLTTIRQPINRFGLLAVETLIDILDAGPEPLRHIILPTELVVRDSCGALRRQL